MFSFTKKTQVSNPNDCDIIFTNLHNEYLNRKVLQTLAERHCMSVVDRVVSDKSQTDRQALTDFKSLSKNLSKQRCYRHVMRNNLHSEISTCDTLKYKMHKSFFAKMDILTITRQVQIGLNTNIRRKELRRFSQCDLTIISVKGT